MKISILIPCHNEEKSIRQCIDSCLAQTRPLDQIVVVDDASTDGSYGILRKYGEKITLVKMEKNTGNKSYAQQAGLAFIAGDVFISTDADSILSKDFVSRVEKGFRDPETVAVSGYVRSMRYNWLTAIRELDYLIGQEIHKTAQANINFLMVIPGCAGAFRTDFFKDFIKFNHDTITEDLDFSYQINEKRFKIRYDKKAIVYTQDPSDIGSYITQLRRWYGGGWQNLAKHFAVVNIPASALELSLTYFEGTIFSFLIFFLPLINIYFFSFFLSFYLSIALGMGLYGFATRKRLDLLLYAPGYVVIIVINSWIFLEQFVKQIILRRKTMVWLSPARRKMA